MKNFAPKLVIILCLAACIYFLQRFGLTGELTLESLKAQQGILASYYSAHPLKMVLLYFLVYVVSTALSVPGALVLSIAAGAFFGFWLGLIIVSFASTIGATLAFLVSRFLLRNWMQDKFGQKLSGVNDGIKKEGVFYLFVLRLIPIIPFFLVNIAMGLTPIKTRAFFVVSQIGMLPATAAYVNAGTQLGQIHSLREILSLNVLISFAIIGILPLLSKKLIEHLKVRKVTSKFRRPKKCDYNIVVIGAGSGGLVSSYIASAVKAKVALIERHKMGGDCLNTGCVPSKAFIRSAKILSYIRRAPEFGLDPLQARFDFASVMERVQRVISKVSPHDSVDRYTKLGVECIQGDARIKSPYEIEVGNRTITARNIIVATGATPLVPSIPGLEQIKYLTSDSVWNIRTLPKRLVILGGGPIGCELAQAFARFGSKVTIVQTAPHILMREDDDVSSFMEEKFKLEGITLLTSHKAKAFGKNGHEYWLNCESGGKENRVEFDEVLFAVGRQANVKGYGLEELGVSISQRGQIVVDEYLRTNFPNIYACGDVTGPYQFTHTAAHQAWYASVNALFSPLKKFKVDYRVIPWSTFTDPEVARVGLNEKEAIEKNIPCEVTKFPIDELDRAIAEEEDHGFVKVLTVPGQDRVLGATIVGHHAGDIIAEYIAAMKHGFGLNKILGTIHIYPTLSESNKYAAGNWKKANAPKKALQLLEHFHSWRRA
ncbi:MAG: dihydrolipoyl dehydrogenase [Deltaproteobacteria bacterium]|nr:dihydrolipoyl dehydrogenase [Deltaproteobacteria bacterium]